MADYHASKAWHFSHELALEVHELVREVVPTDRVANDLAVHLRRTSVTVPAQLKRSLSKELQREKLQCYHEARLALDEVYRHLQRASELQYIESKFFKKLEKKAVVAYRELETLIQSTEAEIART